MNLGWVDKFALTSSYPKALGTVQNKVPMATSLPFLVCRESEKKSLDICWGNSCILSCHSDSSFWTPSSQPLGVAGFRRHRRKTSEDLSFYLLSLFRSHTISSVIRGWETDSRVIKTLKVDWFDTHVAQQSYISPTHSSGYLTPWMVEEGKAAGKRRRTLPHKNLALKKTYGL